MNNTVYYHTAPFKIEKKATTLESLRDEYVRVKFLYCGICGGDYSVYLGRRHKYPVSLGHEWVAKVIQVGKNVKDITENMCVVSDFNYRCGECNYCKNGNSHLCIDNDIERFTNRGFALYADIHYNYLYSIPYMNWLPRACLIEPLSCVLHIFEQFLVDDSEPLLLCGVGSIGMLICFYLTRVKDHKRIYILDHNTERLNKVLECFPVRKYSNSLNIRFNTAIDCTNSIEGLKFALNIINCGGKICIMSHLYGLDTSFVYEHICKKELHPVFPLRNGEKKNMNTAIDLISHYWQQSDDCMLQIYDDIQTAFDGKANSNCNKQIISFCNA